MMMMLLYSFTQDFCVLCILFVHVKSTVFCRLVLLPPAGFLVGIWLRLTPVFFFINDHSM